MIKQSETDIRQDFASFLPLRTLMVKDTVILGANRTRVINIIHRLFLCCFMRTTG